MFELISQCFNKNNKYRVQTYKKETQTARIKDKIKQWYEKITNLKYILLNIHYKQPVHYNADYGIKIYKNWTRARNFKFHVQFINLYKVKFRDKEGHILETSTKTNLKPTNNKTNENIIV